MKLKKILVAALAVTMIMGSSSMAFAAEQQGEGAGSGDLDVVKKTDVFSVVVPTDAGTTFDYIVDPLGVIEETDAEKYGNKVFDHSNKDTVFFQNAEVTSASAQYNYTGTSNKLKAINKSTKAVDIAVEATLTKADEVTMVEATGATSTTDTLLNLQLNGDGGKTAAIGTSATAAKIDANITATPNAYETKFVNGQYVKQLDPTLDDDDFQAYEFWLTGKASASSSWQKVTTLPEVKVVWTVTGEGEAAGPNVTLSSDGLITMSGFTKDINIKDASKDMTLGLHGEDMYPLNVNHADWNTADWDATEGGTLRAQLKGDYKAFNGKRVDVYVKLSNGETISCSGTFTL